MGGSALAPCAPSDEHLVGSGWNKNPWGSLTLEHLPLSPQDFSLVNASVGTTGQVRHLTACFRTSPWCLNPDGVSPSASDGKVAKPHYLVDGQGKIRAKLEDRG